MSTQPNTGARVHCAGSQPSSSARNAPRRSASAPRTVSGEPAPTDGPAPSPPATHTRIKQLEQRGYIRSTLQIMDWPAAQLMTLSLAMATDFDSVFKAWKTYHDEQGHGLFEGDNGFLLAAARRVVCLLLYFPLS